MARNTTSEPSSDDQTKLEILTTPFADLLPPPSTDERDALKTRIEAEGGVHDPVLLTEAGELLDGHHRLNLKSDAPTKVIAGSADWSEATKKAFVVRSNFARRNLSHEQRKEVLAKCKKIAGELKAEGKSQSQIAEMFGVKRNTVSDWLRKHGNNVGADNVSSAGDSGVVSSLDCRVKIDPKRHASIADRMNVGESAEDVAADLKVTRKRVQQIVEQQNGRREKAEERARAAAKVEGDLGIVVGDWREKVSTIPDGSVGLVFCDPDYHKERWAEYGELAQFAGRVLRDGGSLVVYAPNGGLPEILDLMRPHLTYYWTHAAVYSGPTARRNFEKIYASWKPLLHFTKGSSRSPEEWMRDICRGPRDKSLHEWQQAIEEAEHFIRKLTDPGEWVVDAYCGSGTTCVGAKRLGRKWLAFEIDERTAVNARARVDAVADVAKPVHTQAKHFPEPPASILQRAKGHSQQ